jgi:hypothetical protein
MLPVTLPRNAAIRVKPAGTCRSVINERAINDSPSKPQTWNPGLADVALRHSRAVPLVVGRDAIDASD